uniref:Uncharacterized protein n=1 Tax=viral metagenome TaxID=1070528 RepID=A0A6C0BP38_9ZZZZ
MVSITTQADVDRCLAGPEPEDHFHQIAWFYDRSPPRDTEHAEELAKQFYQRCIDARATDWQISTYNLAHMLRFSDTDRAIQLLHTIEDDDVDALSLLAQIYARRDGEKCLHYYQRACDEDVNRDRAAKTMYQLANLYYHTHWCGCKLQKSPEQAFAWYVKSAEAGFSKAWARVADCYHRGLGVTVSFHKETEALLRLPETEWDQTTKFNLAFYYYRGRGCIVPDRERALRMMRELDQEYGDADAQYVLGEAAERDKDLDRARFWYRKAALQNEVSSVKKLWQLAESAGDFDEAVEHLEHLLRIRRQSRAHFDTTITSRTLWVDLHTLDALFEKLADTQRRLQECELRPPDACAGGRLYEDAKQAFQQHAVENDVT